MKSKKTVLIIVLVIVLVVVGVIIAMGIAENEKKEIEQTKKLYEGYLEGQKLQQEAEQTLAESKEKLEQTQNEIEDILGMSLEEATEAMDEGVTLDEKRREIEKEEAVVTDTAEIAAEPAAEPAAELAVWSVDVDDATDEVEVNSDDLSEALQAVDVETADGVYTGYNVGAVIEYAGWQAAGKFEAVLHNDTVFLIDFDTQAGDDALLVSQIDGAYLEGPLLYLDGVLYQPDVYRLFQYNGK